MSDDLDTMLKRLESRKKAALECWVAKQREKNNEFELGYHYGPWVSLDGILHDLWRCAYCVQVGRDMFWMLQEPGRTPTEAAQRLLARMEAL